MSRFRFPVLKFRCSHHFPCIHHRFVPPVVATEFHVFLPNSLRTAQSTISLLHGIPPIHPHRIFSSVPKVESKLRLSAVAVIYYSHRKTMFASAYGRDCFPPLRSRHLAGLIPIEANSVLGNSRTAIHGPSLSDSHILSIFFACLTALCALLLNCLG